MYPINILEVETSGHLFRAHFPIHPCRNTAQKKMICSITYYVPRQILKDLLRPNSPGPLTDP